MRAPLVRLLPSRWSYYTTNLEFLQSAVINMSNEPEKREGERRPTKRRTISVEGAALAFAMFSLANNQQESDRAAKLALRGPDPLKQVTRILLQMLGRDVDQMLIGEPDAPVTKAEVKEFVAIMFRKGAAMAGLTQLLSIYMLDESSTPEEIIYVAYIFLRLVSVGEREPSNEERKWIWDAALEFARHSNIAGRRWKELEEQGQVYLDDWLEETKEKARKKFQTFLSRKQRIAATAEEAFKNLMSTLFDDDESSSQ